MKKNLILPLRLLLIAVLIAAVALTFASCGNENKPAESDTGTETAAPAESSTETEADSLTETEAESLTETEAETEAEPTVVEKKEVGEGAKTIVVNVQVGSEITEITIHTDAENLADALIENKLAEGEEREYGLYIKTVLEKTADDAHFWSIEQNGEMLMTGASTTPIADGETYDFVYTEISF